MISSKDIQTMRKEQEKNLPETVYIQSLVRTSDGAGGWSEAWTTSAVTKGRIASRSKPEEVSGGKLAERLQYLITLPAETDVSSSNRLQINGVQYEILAIERSSNQTALRLVCVEV